MLAAEAASAVRAANLPTASFVALPACRSIGFVAAALGVLFALWSLGAIERLLTGTLPAGTVLTLDGLTLAFTIALSAAAVLVIGLVPAWQASRVNLSEVLKDAARGAPGGARGSRFRNFLITTEVALSVALLIGSGLLLISFVKLQATPAGFNPRGIASAFVNLPAQRYATKGQQADFYYQVIENLRANPQVKGAAAALSLPISGFGPRAVYAVEGRPIPPTSERAIASLNFVSDDYFSLLQIPLQSGRLFAATDREKSPGVCIINASFARRLFPDKPAVGQALLRGQNADIRLEIVGVGTGTAGDREQVAAAIRKFYGLLRDGKIRVDIDRVPLDRVDEVWHRSQGGRRPVLIP